MEWPIKINFESTGYEYREMTVTNQGRDYFGPSISEKSGSATAVGNPVLLLLLGIGWGRYVIKLDNSLLAKKKILTASTLVAQVGEPPDIAEPNRVPNTGQQKLRRWTPLGTAAWCHGWWLVWLILLLSAAAATRKHVPQSHCPLVIIISWDKIKSLLKSRSLNRSEWPVCTS